jgi:IclR family pca regulon transcriptional regulator
LSKANAPAVSAPARRPYTVESLAKGLRILALFSERRPQLRLTDIVAALAMPMPTAFRLVATLESEGFLERLPDGAVRPSAAVLTLGFAALRGLDLVQNSALILRELAESTRQTVNLGVLSHDHVVYVARLQSDTSLVTANITVGSTLPAFCTSMGKVMLAALPDDDVATRVTERSLMGQWGPNASASLAALRAQLQAVRAAGYAVQDEEVAGGLRSIAGGVRGSDGRVIAAVNVAVPAVLFSIDDLRERFRAPLLAACEQISRRMGAPL